MQNALNEIVAQLTHALPPYDVSKLAALLQL